MNVSASFQGHGESYQIDHDREEAVPLLLMRLAAADHETAKLRDVCERLQAEQRAAQSTLATALAAQHAAEQQAAAAAAEATHLRALVDASDERTAQHILTALRMEPEIAAYDAGRRHSGTPSGAGGRMSAAARGEASGDMAVIGSCDPSAWQRLALSACKPVVDRLQRALATYDASSKAFLRAALHDTCAHVVAQAMHEAAPQAAANPTPAAPADDEPLSLTQRARSGSMISMRGSAAPTTLYYTRQKIQLVCERTLAALQPQHPSHHHHSGGSETVRGASEAMQAALASANAAAAEIADALQAKDVELRRALVDKHKYRGLLQRLSMTFNEVTDGLQAKQLEWRKGTMLAVERAMQLGEQRAVFFKTLAAGDGAGGADDDWAELDGDEGGDGGDGGGGGVGGVMAELEAEFQRDLLSLSKEGLLRGIATDYTAHASASTAALRRQLRQKFLLYHVHMLRAALEAARDDASRTRKRSVVLERHLQGYAAAEHRRWLDGHGQSLTGTSFLLRPPPAEPPAADGTPQALVPPPPPSLPGAPAADSPAAPQQSSASHPPADNSPVPAGTTDAGRAAALDSLLAMPAARVLLTVTSTLESTGGRAQGGGPPPRTPRQHCPRSSIAPSVSSNATKPKPSSLPPIGDPDREVSVAGEAHHTGESRPQEEEEEETGALVDGGSDVPSTLCAVAAADAAMAGITYGHHTELWRQQRPQSPVLAAPSRHDGVTTDADAATSPARLPTPLRRPAKPTAVEQFAADGQLARLTSYVAFTRDAERCIAQSASGAYRATIRAGMAAAAAEAPMAQAATLGGARDSPARNRSATHYVGDGGGHSRSRKSPTHRPATPTTPARNSRASSVGPSASVSNTTPNRRGLSPTASRASRRSATPTATAPSVRSQVPWPNEPTYSLYHSSSYDGQDGSHRHAFGSGSPSTTTPFRHRAPQSSRMFAASGDSERDVLLRDLHSYLQRTSRIS